MKADAPVQALSTPRAAPGSAKLRNSASMKPLLSRLRQPPGPSLPHCAAARRSNSIASGLRLSGLSQASIRQRKAAYNPGRVRVAAAAAPSSS